MRSYEDVIKESHSCVYPASTLYTVVSAEEYPRHAFSLLTFLPECNFVHLDKCYSSIAVVCKLKDCLKVDVSMMLIQH